MNEEATPSDAQAMPEPVPMPEQRRAAAGGGLPPWLPLAGLAIVPALIVGILVFALAGSDSGSSSDNAAGIVDGIVGLQSNSNQRVESYKDRLHPDFPTDIQLYKGSKPVVSFAVVSPEGTNMISFLTTSASIDDVYAYFQETLDEDPWQLEFGQRNAEGAVVQFSRPDNADISGAVVIHHSDLDDITSIRIHYEDVSAALTPGTGASNFQLGQSQPLPPGFPSDIPVYKADAGSIIMDTGFQRGQGGQAFAVTFLTKDSQDDVIGFYKKELEDRGWTTTDTSPGGTSFAVSMDFADQNQTLSGQISADSFADDSAYTQVELVVQVTSGRNRGN